MPHPSQPQVTSGRGRQACGQELVGAPGGHWARPRESDPSNQPGRPEKLQPTSAEPQTHERLASSPGQATGPGQGAAGSPESTHCPADPTKAEAGAAEKPWAGSPEPGGARHQPCTRDRGLRQQASRPYHLLSDVDVGLSKGLWQELLPERVHCGGVDGNQGHHACNARGDVAAALCPGSRHLHQLIAVQAALLPWTTSDPRAAAGTSAEPDSQTWRLCPHRPLLTSAHQALACRAQGSAAPGCPQPARTLWAACPDKMFWWDHRTQRSEF